MPNTTTIRVMLIDDHKTMLWGLERLIDGEGARMEVVATAGDCAEALAQIAAAAPDVIVLDLDLGGTCSLDILPALLAAGAARVLVLSGSRDQATLAQAVRGGARGIVSKDAPAELLLQAIVKVHGGELWLDPDMLGRVLGQLMTAPARAPSEDKLAALTAKEKKIIGAIVEGSGAPTAVLAQRLFISEHTLRNHLTSIYQKLGVSNRLELYVYATRHPPGA
ncbi:response regulator transcription factor [Janthinobacterium sp. hw3]|uniref:Response regulator transcription factor n=2 Tax=Janthinobacterium fluminis TaxID=2987524 RepID=A0ABT5K2N2_9BURK|nr:response regulator transcription factor [Janthinobacterium fluminis]MDC8759241.1 response regulator transcription factor [Janthinobacterium fluminis]